MNEKWKVSKEHCYIVLRWIGKQYFRQGSGELKYGCNLRNYSVSASVCVRRSSLHVNADSSPLSEHSLIFAFQGQLPSALRIP